MTAMLHDIQDRHRDVAVAPASLSHFTLTNPRPLADAAVISDPSWSPYCFDTDAGQALFLQTSQADLSQAVFAYETQFQTATRALTLPLDALAAMADALPLPQKILLIFSTGRCGSTLFSRVLGALPDVWSLSEPDPFTNLAYHGHKLPAAQLPHLLRAAMSTSFSPPTPHRVFAPKFRSEVFSQIPDYARSFPDATCCFLFRDLIGFANSSYRFAQSLGFDLSALTYRQAADRWTLISVSPPETTLDVLIADPSRPVGPEIFMAARWLERMEGCIAAAQAGLDMQLISYRHMTGAPEAAFSPVLAACGIDPDDLSKAAHVFDRDSQAGTLASARGTQNDLSEDQIETLHGLSARTDRFARVAEFFGPDSGL